LYETYTTHTQCIDNSLLQHQKQLPNFAKNKLLSSLGNLVLDVKL